MSRFSRITSSKKTRPDSGRSRTWVRENSAWRIDTVVAIAGQAIRDGERMGEPPQPLPQQRVDLVAREVVAELLQPSGVGAGEDAVFQGLEGDPVLGQLSLDVFVPVDAELGVIGEIGAD